MMLIYSVSLKNCGDLLSSSSGGAFVGLARSVLALGGCVFGCVWVKPKMVAIHVRAENELQLEAMRGSKYVRSDISQALSELKEELMKGRKVLFTGTPCQIAAARMSAPSQFHDNLFLVEIICHGAPDPRVWESYKQYLGKPLSDVCFKDKTHGWNYPMIRLHFADGEVRKVMLYGDPYIRAFENGLSQSDGCFVCRFKSGKSGADLTIGDFWGIEETDANYQEIKRGVSIVVTHSGKGVELLRSASSLNIRPIKSTFSLDNFNPSYAKPINIHPLRQRFWNGLAKQEDFRDLVLTCLDGGRLKRMFVRILKGMRRRVAHAG